jgi:cation diffusion facilitator CzcD-associated flavoprotein CzcO
VIGAGPSGLAAIKNLQEQGVTDITVFEKNDQIGGNWIYDETNNHSSIYETTHIISSKCWSEFEDFPMPSDYPDYPSHQLVLDYFKNYANYFDLTKFIRFDTQVLQVEPTETSQWKVLFEDEQGIHKDYFDYLLIANGHHWDPVLPEYPGDFSVIENRPKPDYNNIGKVEFDYDNFETLKLKQYRLGHAKDNKKNLYY